MAPTLRMLGLASGGAVLAGIAVTGRAGARPPTTAGAAPVPLAWANESASPREVDFTELSDREADLQRECGRGDAGLRAVARRLVDRKLHDLAYLDADGLSQAERVAGEPHVWPRAWVVSGLALNHESTKQRLGAWGATFHEPGDRRCGVAIGYAPNGTEAIAAVALDAEADLSPLPIRTHVGSWISLDAKLVVPAMGARVIVMGPTGLPRSVPTALHEGRIRAQISLDRPGAFTVQVVADVASGPRPVLEAELFADVPPWTEMPDLAAPGEAAASPSLDDTASLTAMIASMRATERLAPFARDPRLDAIATAHAQRMQASRSVAHDVGDGDPLRRVQASGLRVRESGENVAHAASIVLAHRALYASPSHRANLLSVSFDRVGLGVMRDPDGSVWVTEEFARSLP